MWHFVIPVEEQPLEFVPLAPDEAARELAGYAEFVAPGEPIVAALWERALADDRADFLALEGRIRAAAAVGDFALAHELWERLSEQERLSPRAAWTAGTLAHAEYASLAPDERATAVDQLADARRHYRRVLETEPDRVRVLAALGQTHVLDEDGDPAPGIEALERAVSEASGDPEIRLDLATLLLRVGKIAEAQAAHRGRDLPRLLLRRSSERSARAE